jgi:hypothetical protein
MSEHLKKAINSHPFVIFVDPDQTAIQKIQTNYFTDQSIASSSIKVISANSPVDEFKEFFRDIDTNPIIGSQKLYIIQDFEQLNYLKANIMLKLIDQNESQNKVIGLTLTTAKILGTVKSRALVVTLPSESHFDQKLESIFMTSDVFGLIEYLNENKNSYMQFYKLINNSDKLTEKQKIWLSQNLDLLLNQTVSNELISIKLLKEN